MLCSKKKKFNFSETKSSFHKQDKQIKPLRFPPSSELDNNSGGATRNNLSERKNLNPFTIKKIEKKAPHDPVQQSTTTTSFTFQESLPSAKLIKSKELLKKLQSSEESVLSNIKNKSKAGEQERESRVLT